MSAPGAPPPVRLDRACALRDTLFPGADSTEAERRFVDAVLARFAEDRRHFSDILEWSLSEDERGVDTARFSYAFPGFVRAREDVTRAVLAWADGLGEAASRAAKSVLRAARSPTVEQVLMGYARGTGGGPPRTKFYLQFRDGAGPAALALSRAILGTQRATQSDGLPLHLLGLDMGPEGLAGAKLYFAHIGDPPRIEGFSGPVRNALWIHRLRHPDDPTFEAPTEIDFALAGSTWDALTSSPTLTPHAAARAAFDALGASFRLRARRASLGLHGARKLNVYYVLDEPEP
ncbi:hypothetical protein [Polyangium spumosum]|uniref:Uncharacterized protein n=1 Tax=Polyangium spumosum TaxID=889282 RepID=A0A6N7PSP3_9BACT|nr:hypothetical protein [Polyangium spumosum]MRG95003.1 hypothetical protein [Polyangium spumosum]